jgi:hypothetical protein
MTPLLPELRAFSGEFNSIHLSLKLLRRVFEEQFELVKGTLQPRLRRPSSAVQNPHDPDAHYADKGKNQWVGYKVHVAESVDPKQPAKGDPTESFITEILTTEAAQDEMAGLAQALKSEQELWRSSLRRCTRMRAT